MRWRLLSFRAFWALWVPVLPIATAVAASSACSPTAAVTPKKDAGEVDPFDDFVEEDPTPIEPTYTDDEAGTVAQDRPKPEGGTGADGGIKDSSSGGADAGPCGTLMPGDLLIVELMVSSRSGAGDEAEWIEVRNMRNCTISLTNITVESPRGAVNDTVSINSGDKILPGETFVVASSSDPTKNNNLPGKVFGWNTTDVLKNDGDIVRVLKGTTVIDSVTFPRFTNLTPGRSLAFPSDCDPVHHPTWDRWSLSFSTWNSAPAGMKGSPNAPNDDVACF
ncbi:MAG: lamin tail domain-containing protein [Polyangiaceae bacterium]